MSWCLDTARSCCCSCWWCDVRSLVYKWRSLSHWIGGFVLAPLLETLPFLPFLSSLLLSRFKTILAPVWKAFSSSSTRHLPNCLLQLLSIPQNRMGGTQEATNSIEKISAVRVRNVIYLCSFEFVHDSLNGSLNSSMYCSNNQSISSCSWKLR